MFSLEDSKNKWGRKEPYFHLDACPGFLGKFVELATRESEADPAAIALTFLVRFCSEIFAYDKDAGPYMQIGEVKHPPRIDAVLVGKSSRARKGTSRHPVTKVFSRHLCKADDLRDLPLPPRESDGPLATGEGLAYAVRELTDEEFEAEKKKDPSRNRHDTRLIVYDEEFGSALASTKRQGNTLSPAVRSFWDSGNCSPLTKNNRITVKNAHICFITHITEQELNLSFADIEVFNGFGNRLLWAYVMRRKLVPVPHCMPEDELRPLQRELMAIIAYAQKQGCVALSAEARGYWEGIYEEITQEYPGLVGAIISRSEAHIMRLALTYTLLDKKNEVELPHLKAALAMWKFCEQSAIYLFGKRSADPNENKIISFLQNGPSRLTDLNKAFNGHMPSSTLRNYLDQMAAQGRLEMYTVKGNGPNTRMIRLLS